MAGITVSDSDGWEEDVVAVFPGTGFLVDDFLGKKLDGRNLASVGTGGHGEKRVLDSHDNIVTEEKEKGKSPTKFPWGCEFPWGEWIFFDEKQERGPSFQEKSLPTFGGGLWRKLTMEELFPFF